VSLSYRLQALGFRLLVAGFTALPLSIGARLGAWLGELLCFVDRPHRRIALQNLALAFPEKPAAEHHRILRASCRNLGRMAAEFCHLPKLDRESLGAIIEFSDRVAWEKALQRCSQTGAIVLTAHFGNWELLAHAHGLLGHPVTLIHRPMRNALVDDAIARMRAHAGTRSIPKKAAARDAIRTLRAGGILAIPSDQNQTTRYGVFVDFFGRPACTTPGVARLAALTGAPIFPVFLMRIGESGRHRFEILPEVDLISTGDRDADVITNTQRCSRIIEDMIRRCPEQWIWFHRRWKTRPGD
jgi:KDO2-lipid IV(A) lauroyltransferase